MRTAPYLRRNIRRDCWRLSDKLARTLFNTTDNVIGKTIHWDRNDEFKGVYAVSGIYEAPPSNATDQFDLLFSWALFATKEGGGDGDITYWASNARTPTCC